MRKEKEKLSRSFKDMDVLECNKIYEYALDLTNVCYEYGDKARKNQITKKDALEDMEIRFPGFSQKTYKAAFAHGLFESR